MQTLLSRATAADVSAEPFPHLVIRDAIDPALCAELIAHFPSLETVAQGAELGSNKRFSLPAAAAAGNPGVSPKWQDFVAANVSQPFLDQLVALFGDHIRHVHPMLEDKLGRLEDLRAGVRPPTFTDGEDRFAAAEVLLDAQISINSPVTGTPSSVRSTHLDDPNKLFAGLFYMRRPDDDSEGGNLELLRYRGRPRGFRGPMVYDRFVDVVETVPYAANVLVIFLNSEDSLHGVTIRSKTDVPRTFVNLVAEVPQPLFDLAPLQATTADKLAASPEILGQKIRTAVGR